MRERVRDCVRLCVCRCPLWCPYLCEGRCARSLHTGLSQCAFPKRETPATASPSHNGLTTPHPLCATSRDFEPLALLLARNFLKQTTGRVSSDRLTSRVDFAQPLASMRCLVTQSPWTRVITHGFRDGSALNSRIIAP